MNFDQQPFVTRHGDGGHRVWREMSAEEVEEHKRLEQIRAGDRLDPSVRTIAQKNGAEFSRGATDTLAITTRPTGETLELALSLLKSAESRDIGSTIFGFSALALVATGDRDLAGKFAGLWEFRSSTSRAVTVRHGAMIATLRHHVAHNHCGCAAKAAKQPDACSCVDRAMWAVSDGLRDGSVVELNTPRAEPISEANGYHRCFSTLEIENLRKARS